MDEINIPPLPEDTSEYEDPAVVTSPDTSPDLNVPIAPQEKTAYEDSEIKIKMHGKYDTEEAKGAKKGATKHATPVNVQLRCVRRAINNSKK